MLAGEVLRAAQWHVLKVTPTVDVHLTVITLHCVPLKQTSSTRHVLLFNLSFHVLIAIAPATEYDIEVATNDMTQSICGGRITLILF